MGIVLKQSLNNTLITYGGFAIGALNLLFLYTRFLSDEYFGLVNVILSASSVLMPLLAFGIPNAMVKYYSGFQELNTKNSFLTLMVFLPLILIVPIGAISYLANEAIGDFLSKENPIVKGYVWHIFIIGVAMAYFEVFYAWAKVQMKSVFGNFMKEVFSRIVVTFLLLLVYWDQISVLTFLNAMVGMYILRTIIMQAYALRTLPLKLDFGFPANSREIIGYATLIILGGSAAIVLLEVDKVMINQFIEIKNVAYYSVAGYIATVIAVPSRSMHNITYPLTADILHKKDIKALKTLYQKSSLTLFIVSGLIFILIVLNLNDLYNLLPESYRGGYVIVFIIGFARVYDALLGNNNAIMYNSDFYRALLLMGVALAILTILLNLWLIPKYGLDGAAIASFMAFFIYNTIKLGFVKWKFDIQPFTKETFKVVLLLFTISIIFYFVTFTFHPVVNIVLKSMAILVCYLYLLYRFRISEDVFGAISFYLQKLGIKK
ncbi:polysaccharide biosynthesis C-terminal domain-containing protein [Arenibacter sp. M-2]|uniref:oligosaccharide flippase family protein n=1 Tax=unclassified Arenibacter TaxID=2615047 RepID=UPI000D755689|nr:MULTISPECIES: polysaccharide biosynthesis C-terminal domain-containing protein [unclassified Arenibacter]MDL5512762.1 polysaccharide biosynthesis C-terminal domain-containing protein [Arenibacter sp. M-2]PXX24985.1 O-antigen/teichoic acid export membrane protein [Arenibacter sp. ARW7G5Y1]|tara:strand:+ start:3931 stop:5400 length:1470 start_codon:yes stop_codon:yes gene_type:complete